MALKCDRDGLGAARTVGGGGVNAGFRTTMAAPRVDIRDPEVRRRQSVPLDMRRAPRYKGKMDEEQLLTFASATLSRAAFNRTTVAKPELRRDLREETNGTIQEYNRQKRAEVLRVAQADLAAADEHKALAHTYAQLLRVADLPERVIWLADQTETKAATRPILDDPAYRELVAKECTLARRWLARIQDRVIGTRNAMRTFEAARQTLANHLASMKVGLDLMPDTYSGAVAHFPAARFDDPPCLSHVAELYRASQTRRSADEKAIAACGRELSAAQEDVQQALDDARQRSRDLQRDMMLAKGAARLAKNKVMRSEHSLEIAAGGNEGPAEGAAYMFTRERPDRPLVRKYNEIPGHAAHGVTAREDSKANKELFHSSTRMVQNDADDLNDLMRAMSATLHDRNRNLYVDGEISRQRTRLGPGRRP
mmetsp:Transcript_16178/g.41963  ORF Transcript_16178/g.41963 Transcript_16178/m.41963 type:complete len:424 (-) Transcript_16178:45-1316(-)